MDKKKCVTNGKCTWWNITHLLKNNIMKISGKWTGLGRLILSKVTQTQMKNILCISVHIDASFEDFNRHIMLREVMHSVGTRFKGRILLEIVNRIKSFVRLECMCGAGELKVKGKGRMN